MKVGSLLKGGTLKGILFRIRIYLIIGAIFSIVFYFVVMELVSDYSYGRKYIFSFEVKDTDGKPIHDVQLNVDCEVERVSGFIGKRHQLKALEIRR